MMRIYPVSWRKVVRALVKLGFKPIRQRGSHLILKRKDGKVTVVPIHSREEIGRGLLRRIAYDAGMTLHEFFEVVIKDP